MSLKTYNEHNGEAGRNCPAREDEEDLLKDAPAALPGLAADNIDSRLALGAPFLVQGDVDHLLCRLEERKLGALGEDVQRRAAIHKASQGSCMISEGGGKEDLRNNALVSQV